MATTEFGRVEALSKWNKFTNEQRIEIHKAFLHASDTKHTFSQFCASSSLIQQAFNLALQLGKQHAE